MISGAMLLDFDKKYNLKTYFSKRISKTIIPYIFWTVIGLLFEFYYLNSIPNLDFNVLINCLITGRSIPAYWFFIPLFGLYVLFPIFTYFVDCKKNCLYFMGFLLIINCLLYFFNITFVGYAFFAVFGFYIHKYGINKKMRYIFYLFAIIGFLANTFGSYYISIVTGRLFRSYIYYTLIPAMLYPLGLFVFIKYELVKLMEIIYISISFVFRFLYIWNILNPLVYSSNIN